MKIVREKSNDETTVITVRLPKSFLKRLNAQVKKADMKREPFIRAVLEQVLNDETFVLRVKEKK